MLVLAWRGLVAWSIRRSVKRVALAQSRKYGGGPDARSGGGKTKSGYFNPAAGSTLSLDLLAGSGKGGPQSGSAHNSLFFSPTAAGGAMQNHNANRGSAYLPSGFYASGNPAASGMTHLGAGGPMSSATNQNRHSARHSKLPSPPRSPSLPPSRGHDSPRAGRLSTQGLINHKNHASTSSLNLTAPAPDRAPSAYLDDLFENHPPGNPRNSDGRRAR